MRCSFASSSHRRRNQPQVYTVCKLAPKLLFYAPNEGNRIPEATLEIPFNKDPVQRPITECTHILLSRWIWVLIRRRYLPAVDSVCGADYFARGVVGNVSHHRHTILCVADCAFKTRRRFWKKPLIFKGDIWGLLNGSK